MGRGNREKNLGKYGQISAHLLHSWVEVLSHLCHLFLGVEKQRVASQTEARGRAAGTAGTAGTAVAEWPGSRAQRAALCSA
jgi:hypothetical protein